MEDRRTLEPAERKLQKTSAAGHARRRFAAAGRMAGGPDRRHHGCGLLRRPDPVCRVGRLGSRCVVGGKGLHIGRRRTDLVRGSPCLGDQKPDWIRGEADEVVRWQSLHSVLESASEIASRS